MNRLQFWNKSGILRVISVAVALLGLPMLGVFLDGRPIQLYLEFPPATQHVEHAPFAWPAFVVLCAVACALVLPVVLRILLNQPKASRLKTERTAFPWWGWVGLVLGTFSWILAWNRFRWFAPVQRYTFTPLWLAYILVVNALTCRRSGRCMLKDRPALFLVLFPVSGAFWWFFEYLNRFTQNWSYVGVEGLPAADYFLQATLSFATVLPAVCGTYELLKSVPRLSAGLEHFAALRVRHPALLAGVALAAASAGLAGIGIWPNLLFPLLWVSPLLIIIALQTLAGLPHRLTPLARGDWRELWIAAVAALVCGFFWEMWNYHSLAKWIYTVPYVGGFKIFEMPLTGYLGYLPFGLECLVIADWVAAALERPAASRPAV